MMRGLAAIIQVVLIGLCALACGGGNETTSEATATPAPSEPPHATPAFTATPTLDIASPNTRAAAIETLRAEAPRLVDVIDAFERGDVEAILDQLTFHRLVCKERPAEFPYELCDRGEGDLELEVFPVQPLAGAEWNQREELGTWLAKWTRGPERSLEFIARRSDGTYTLVFFIEPTLFGEGGSPTIVLWLQLPVGSPPTARDPADPEREYILRIVDRGFLPIITRSEELNRLGEEDQPTYDILWASTRVLDAEENRVNGHHELNR